MAIQFRTIALHAGGFNLKKMVEQKRQGGPVTIRPASNIDDADQPRWWTF